MKKNGLIVGQAIILSVILIFFGLVIINEKIPSLNKKRVLEEINNYYKKHYNNLAVNKKEIKYNKENKTYSITYYNKDYANLNFTIYYKDGKITDNYQENYVEGKEVIKIANKMVAARFNEVFLNSIYEKIKIEFNSLDKYDVKTIENILNNNIYDTGYYKVSYYVRVQSLDDIYLNNLINSFNTIAKNNGLVVNSYSITFDNFGIIKIVNKES